MRLLLFLLLCRGSFAAERAEVVFERATQALAAGDYAAAEKGFLEVHKLEPRNVGALGNLGVVYSRTNRFADAIQAYKRALVLAPGDKFLTTNLGLAYVHQEQYRTALPVFEKLAKEPGNQQALELLGTCHLALGQEESALAALGRIPAADRSPGALYSMGIALTRLKRVAEAHDAFEKMVARVGPAQANFLMGKASYETERFAEAAAFFRKAIEVDGAHRELGKSLVSMHEDEAAMAELRQAGPNDAEALYYLGAMVSRDHPDEGVALLEKAHKLNPDFWAPLYYLGRIRAQTGDLNRAAELLSNAARLNPDESAVFYQLGQVLKKLGKTPEAEAALARVKTLKARSLQREIDLLKR